MEYPIHCIGASLNVRRIPQGGNYVGLLQGDVLNTTVDLLRAVLMCYCIFSYMLVLFTCNAMKWQVSRKYLQKSCLTINYFIF